MNYESGAVGEAERYTLPDMSEGGGRRRRWVVYAVVAAAIVLVVGYLALGHSKPVDQPFGAVDPSTQIPTVSVMQPGNDTIVRDISATGTIAARREMPVGVAGEGGRVTRVLVDAGTWVKAGQVLAMVDRSVQAETATSLAAQVRVAEADAKLAQSDLDRARQLVSRGFISQADIDSKTATRDAAVARVNVAKASLAETHARNSRLDIRAPAAGLVLTRDVEPGQIVSAGSGVLFRVALGGQMEMQAKLAEADLARLSTGVSATVTPVGTDQHFTGQIWQISSVIDPTTRQGIARIALAYAPALRPGGFASAQIIAGSNQAPLLPESAVQSDGGRNYVYIVGKDDKVVRRDVTTGEVSDKGVAIAKGLDGSERVVVSAGAFLNPGDKVKPVLQKRAN
ncbi:efflux RND transporter periplasmic adaptor subunit [Hephaestia sp. GCM10023244]|uniref:efflux RND transporter periplasmic adaptor subunit n=1 Tax=unclassified Hephaestia TaxID=2631281 RepID=UPI002076E689|nr:efflux RND transporter periplasmic adaptor subunit [Hephaestia sp. MAHUQ-44]MCM8729722.1 efflux RND transporter periplasmic adaptor subunit [Hephaestia sp. MAHUQ-44]